MTGLAATGRNSFPRRLKMACMGKMGVRTVGIAPKFTTPNTNAFLGGWHKENAPI